MLIKLENGSPVGNAVLDDNFRQLFPRTSFPKLLTPEVVEPFGYGMYEFSPRPTPNRYQKTVEVIPVCGDRGIWRQTWQLVEMTPSEKQETDAQQAFLVRGDRNSRLTASDWTQLPDAPVDRAEWATYRQQLRDVTEQAGFPWDVTWPSQPS